jgi:hypothetical protein
MRRFSGVSVGVAYIIKKCVEPQCMCCVSCLYDDVYMDSFAIMFRLARLYGKSYALSRYIIVGNLWLVCTNKASTLI